MLPSSALFIADSLPLEHLSDTSFLGKLLVFLANVILNWKVIASSKHSSLFCLVVNDEGKSFITLTPVENCCATLLSLSVTKRSNKLERLSLANLSSPV